MRDPVCPIHHCLLRCLKCQSSRGGKKGGAIGGKVLSEKKLAALKRIAKLPRPRTKGVG